jgi:hypothetical protein
VGVNFDGVDFLQTLAITPIPAVTYSTKKTTVLTLKSNSSAGLPGTTYAIDNSAVGYINNSTLVILGKGTATITATNPGNGIYNPTSATQTLNVR